MLEETTTDPKGSEVDPDDLGLRVKIAAAVQQAT